MCLITVFITACSYNRFILYSVDYTKMTKVPRQWHYSNSFRYCNLLNDWLIPYLYWLCQLSIVHSSNGRLCLQWIYKFGVAATDCGEYSSLCCVHAQMMNNISSL